MKIMIMKQAAVTIAALYPVKRKKILAVVLQGHAGRAGSEGRKGRLVLMEQRGLQEIQERQGQPALPVQAIR